MGCPVLVTGGAGYIGSHACKALAGAGYRPVAFDNLRQGHRWAVRWGPLEVGDTRDRARVADVLARHGCEAVMHFAAHAYVGESVADPAKYYDNNVSGTLSLLAAMRDAGVERLVFSSTCATYGIPTRLPIDETQPQLPVNPYGRSKLMIEQILRDYAAAYGLASVSLRYFNAAGADPDGEIGELHRPETHLIPLVLDVAAGHAEAVRVLGDDYPTPDGTCIRDYVHVTDLADAHVRALGYLQHQRGANYFNLGNGQGFSVMEIIDAARRVTGQPIPVQIDGRRPGDPPVLVGDAGQAREVLGWRPALTCVDTIIGTAWAWHRSLQDEATLGGGLG